MKFFLDGNLHTRVIKTILQILTAIVCFNQVQAKTCETGQERDGYGNWMWVLAADNPCECTRIVMGGRNTITPKRTFEPIYVKKPLISADIQKIRQHFKIQCDRKESTSIKKNTVSPTTQSVTTKSGELTSVTTKTVLPSSQSVTTKSADETSFMTTKPVLPTTQSVTSKSADETTATTKKPVLSTKQAVTTHFGDESTFITSKPVLPTTQSVTIKSADETTVTTKKTVSSTKQAVTTQSGDETTSITTKPVLPTTQSVTTKSAVGTTPDMKEDVYPTTQRTTTEPGEECTSPGPLGIGMRDNTIQDTQITASSSQTNRNPHKARLIEGTSNFWISLETDEKPWIQVDFEEKVLVTALKIQGNDGGGEWKYWVEQIEVQVGPNCNELEYIMNTDKTIKVFNANQNAVGIADVPLHTSGISTRFLKIYPKNCKKNEHDWNTCLMRFEVIGCRGIGDTGETIACVVGVSSVGVQEEEKAEISPPLRAPDGR